MNPRNTSRLALAALLTAFWAVVIDVGCQVHNGSPFPESRQLLALTQGHAQVVLALGLALVLLTLLAGSASRHWPLGGARSQMLWSAVVFGVATVPGALLLAGDLASGDWISRQKFAAAFHVGATVAVVVGAALAALVHSWLRHRLVGALALGLATLVAVANGLFLLGLYQGLHVALYLGALIFAFAGFERLLPASGWHTSRRAALAFAPLVPLAAAVGLFLTPASRYAGIRLSPALPSIAAVVLRPSHTDLLVQVASQQKEEPVRPKPAAHQPFGKPIKNVILLVVDTMRGDVLPPVRTKESRFFKSSDTPFLNQRLKSAQRFTNAYSQASRTNRSMPATLHSIESFEEKSAAEPSLGARFAALGLVPRAVVPEWFFMPNAGRAGQLLEQFEDVRAFKRSEHHKFTAFAKDALGPEGGAPFFLWLHYFGLHEPYFEGPKAPKRSGSKEAVPDRYRGAVRYMDQQFRLLFEELERRKLLDETLVVLMADHGELLGEGGLIRHGQGIAEAEVHVPLVFWVPGAEPSVTQALAGNIDVLPTIFELLGADPVGMRGTSLVETMRTRAERSDRELYVLSGNGQFSGLITQDHRLLFSHQMGHFALYDRGDADQRFDLLGKSPELDERLRKSFVERNPALFENDLDDSAARSALTEKLDGLAAKEPSRALEVLVELAVRSKSPETLEAIERLYARGSDSVRRVLLVEAHATAPALWTKRAEELLRKSESVEGELSVLSALMRVDAQDLDGSIVSARLEEVALDCKSRRADAWLTYVTPRKKTARDIAALSRMLECARREDPEGRSGLLPKVLRALAPRREAQGLFAPLEPALIPLVGHASEAVAVEACRSLASASSPEAIATLSDRKTLERGPRVSTAALQSLGAIQGGALTPLLLELARDERHTMAVIRTLEAVGDARAVPYLTNVATKSSNFWLTTWAKNALKSINKRVKRAAAKSTNLFWTQAAYPSRRAPHRTSSTAELTRRQVAGTR